MRIRITEPGQPAVIHPTIKDACLYLMERYRDQVNHLMGKPSLTNLLQYTKLATVEKVDTSVHWASIQGGETK